VELCTVTAGSRPAWGNTPWNNLGSKAGVVGFQHIYKTKGQPSIFVQLGTTLFDPLSIKMVNTGDAGDPIVTRLVEEDKVRWWQKPNLRWMYLYLFLCCMGVEMTSGFDSQLINTLQFSQPFNKCGLLPYTLIRNMLTLSDFGAGHKDEKGKWGIEPSLLGFISSCYQLGSIFAVPFAPWMNQRFGRRWSVMIGSLIMVVGALIQGFSQHSR
jgi:hypothetical protein